MTAALKNVEPELVFVDVTRKPESFLKLGGSSVPLMQHDELILKDSNAISHYLDEKFPPANIMETDDEACNSAGINVFGKFIPFVKNKDSALDNSLRKSLLDEMRIFNDFLSSRPHRFIASDNLTHPDCSLLPKLYHIRVAGKFFKNFDIPKDFARLHEYVRAGFETDAFKKTLYQESEVIAGWQKHMK